MTKILSNISKIHNCFIGSSHKMNCLRKPTKVPTEELLNKHKVTKHIKHKT